MAEQDIINIDSIINKARTNLKPTEKGLKHLLVRGSEIPRPTEDDDFVHWKNSSWELLTSIKGVPFGKIVQISGRPDSGKSTHAMEFMKRAQDQGHIVILWDSESKFDPTRFDEYFNGSSKDLLVDTSKMILEGGDMVDFLVHAAKELYPNKKILIVWDSVGGTVAKGEWTKSKRETKQMAEASKDNGTIMRGFIQLMEQYKNPKTGKYTIGVLLINQVYANIGAPGYIESGGQKVEYFSSLIVQLTRKADLFRMRGKVKRKVGLTTRARVKKNHLFSAEDTIAEMLLDITAGGVTVNKLDPATAIVAKDQVSKEDLIPEEDLVTQAEQKTEKYKKNKSKPKKADIVDPVEDKNV
jgi:RecA/RadA recombinase